MKIKDNYGLELVVFLSGAIVMILELAGVRMLAPYYGTSLNTWSVMIGVVLGSMSLGYWYGGKTAAKHASYKGLSQVTLFAGINLLLISLFKDLIIYTVGRLPYLNLVWGCLIVSLVLFLLPNLLLGMITPYVVQLKLKSLHSTGMHVGNLYALSTIGSIGGTLLAGFVLIPLLGTSKIIILLGIILVVLSVFLAPASRKLMRFFVLFISFILLYGHVGYERFATGKGLIDMDSSTGKILVFKTKHPITHVPSIYLITGAFGYQSAKSGDDYSPYIPLSDRVIRSFGNKNKKMLVIGAGGFSLPDYFLSKYPDMNIDAIEIDDKIAWLASVYFGHKDNPRLTTYIADGRMYINSAKQKYDVIYNDAYTDLYPPFTLNTQEAGKKIYELLNENGLYLSNVISPLEGDNSRLFQAVYKTYRSVFPEVIVLPMQEHVSKSDPQNILLIGVKTKMSTPIPASSGIYKLSWSGKVPDSTPILRDDFAPIEGYLLPITSQKPRYPLSRYFLEASIRVSQDYLSSLLRVF